VESTLSSSSSGTHSDGKWSKGMPDWQAFEEVTSHPSGTKNVAQGKKPMAPKDNEDDDVEYNSSSEDDAKEDDDK
jgi:hypothetical protein